MASLSVTIGTSGEFYRTLSRSFRVAEAGQQEEKAKGQHVGPGEQRAASAQQKEITGTEFFTGVTGEPRAIRLVRYLDLEGAAAEASFIERLCVTVF